MSDLRLQNKAHEVCSKLFLRVAQLCQIFAYRTRHTKCVVSYSFGSLTYVTSSLTEQGTSRVQWGVSSGRSLMSDLRLQNEAHELCSKLFLWVAQLCQIFACRTRHTLCVVSYFFGSLTYFRSSLTEKGTRSVYWVISLGRSVMSDLGLQNKAHEVCSKLLLRVAQLCQYLCQIFDYRTRHTPCVVCCFFGSLSYVRS